MMAGFGSMLIAHAASVARRGAVRMGDAMVAAAEAELPMGVSVGKDGDDVVIRGERLGERYWGTARHPPDMELRMMILRLINGGGT